MPLEKRGIMPRMESWRCQICKTVFDVPVGGDCVDLQEEHSKTPLTTLDNLHYCPTCGSLYTEPLKKRL